jgi:hypothetical protein
VALRRAVRPPEGARAHHFDLRSPAHSRPHARAARSRKFADADANAEHEDGDHGRQRRRRRRRGRACTARTFEADAHAGARVFQQE